LQRLVFFAHPGYFMLNHIKRKPTPLNR